MPDPIRADVEATLLRLFVAHEGAALRKEDRQKSAEIAGLLRHLAPLRKGAHLVDAAAGKSSVGFVAAELLAVTRLTVIERAPDRIAACRAAAARLRPGIVVDVREADVGDAAAWPIAPDVVVALHACGSAADLVLDGAIRAEARRVLVAPCCYGKTIPFRDRAMDAVVNLGFVADDVLRRRMAAALVDLERKLRLEAGGYETDIEEFVAPTVTPHNLAFVARRTCSPVRMARARDRLDALSCAARGATMPS